MLLVASGMLLAGLINDRVGMDEFNPGWAYGDVTSERADGDSKGAKEAEKGLYRSSLIVSAGLAFKISSRPIRTFLSAVPWFSPSMRFASDGGWTIGPDWACGTCAVEFER